MATARQLEANRRNAEKSTGPRTEAGKARSRRNALKHGLAGPGIVLPEDEADLAARRREDWAGPAPPADPYQAWLREVIAAESARLDRCRRHEAALREEAALRARESWDEDRDREAAAIASGLTSDPAATVARLRASPHGCRLLRSWWEALLRAAVRGFWNPEQLQVALDLAGTPRGLQATGSTPLDALGNGTLQEKRVALASAQIAELDRRLAGPLAERDARDRLAAARGLDDRESPALARVRRYENACLRRLRWASAQLRDADDPPTAPEPPHASPAPEPRPTPTEPPSGLATAPVRASGHRAPGASAPAPRRPPHAGPDRKGDIPRGAPSPTARPRAPTPRAVPRA